MIFCVAVDCKSDSRQGKAEISSQYNTPECVMLSTLAKIPAGKRCDFS